MRIQFKPFWKKSSNYRKKKTFCLKKKIESCADILGGLFYTQDYMDGHNQWVDVYFLSTKDKRNFFNAEFTTTRLQAKEKIESLVSDRSYEIHPVTNFRLKFVKIGNGLSIFDPEMIKAKIKGEREAFNGLTRFEWGEKEVLRMLENNEILPVREQAIINRKYAYGTGLYVTLNVPYLTIDAINDFILKFRENGEKPFEGEDIILSSEELSDRFLTVSSNALIKPEDWPEEKD